MQIEKEKREKQRQVIRKEIEEMMRKEFDERVRAREKARKEIEDESILFKILLPVLKGVILALKKVFF